MNKNKQQLIGLITTSIVMCHPSLYAGGMGGEDPIMYSNSVMPFVSLEGGYTWNKLKGFGFSTTGASISSKTKDTGWSGRLAAGLLIPYCETISFSSELGYGFYGKTKYELNISGSLGAFTANPSSSDMRAEIDGLDILAGVYYRPGGYELFFKGGGLVENTHYETRANLATLTFGHFSGDAEVNRTHTEVLPEIKLGAAFSFANNYSVFAAWFHAFGSSPSVSANFGTGAGLTNAGLTVNDNGPTLDVLTLGFQYNFA